MRVRKVGRVRAWRDSERAAPQVSHHPPMLAMHCEGARWASWLCYGLVSVFRGQSIAVTPQADQGATFKGSGNKYRWGKVRLTRTPALTYLDPLVSRPRKYLFTVRSDG